jgi:hypothetical protein
MAVLQQIIAALAVLEIASAEMGDGDMNAVCSVGLIPMEGVPVYFDVECLLAQFGAHIEAEGDLVFAEPSDGCNIDGTIVNTTLITGNILLVDRGTCSFAKKAVEAQRVGATAVIVVNSDDKDLFFMADPTAEGKSLTIPTAIISKSSGLKLRESVSQFKSEDMDLERIHFVLGTTSLAHSKTRLVAATADELMNFVLGSSAETVLIGFSDEEGEHKDYENVINAAANLDFPCVLAPDTMATEFGPNDLDKSLPVMVCLRIR